MSSTASPDAPVVRADQRLEVLFDELAELTGQRNAIDGRIVEIVAELDRDELCGAPARGRSQRWWPGRRAPRRQTPTRSRPSRTGWPSFPAAPGMREGRLSLDQVGVIAGRAGEGSDAHYAELARCATVNQLRTAVKLEPRPEPEPEPDLPARARERGSITKTTDERCTCWRITLAASGRREVRRGPAVAS